MNKNINWIEEMTEQERNEIEIQMIRNPELDNRMNKMEKQNLKEFWENYNQLKHIYDRTVIQHDKIDHIVGLIDNLEYYIISHPKPAGDCTYMVPYDSGHEYQDVSKIISRIKTKLLKRKANFEKGINANPLNKIKGPQSSLTITDDRTYILWDAKRNIVAEYLERNEACERLKARNDNERSSEDENNRLQEIWEGEDLETCHNEWRRTGVMDSLLAAYFRWQAL